MATEGGSQDIDVRLSGLGLALQSHPGRFDFFQAIRLIERMHPTHEPVGQFGLPAREAVRFSVNNSLVFPPSQIQSVEWLEGERPVVTVNFLGLTGPMGVLPTAYTELVRDRNQRKDVALAAFLDLFNHRLLSLFYQAWKKYRFFVPYERESVDRFSGYLRGLVGLATGGLEKRQAVQDQSILYYSGLFSLQSRSASSLEQLLSDYFDIPIQVEQFVGAWYEVPASDQCSLDSGREYSDALGSAVAGDEIWDHQARARVVIGPIPLAQYRDFLPAVPKRRKAGRAYHPLQALLRLFSGNETEFEIQLVLEREQVPKCELGVEGEQAPLLGWTSWIKSGDSFGRDPADAVLLLNRTGSENESENGDENGRQS